MPPKDSKRDPRTGSTQPLAGNPGDPTENNAPYRRTEKVEARLNPYIEAHQKDMAYYERLVAENPQHTVRTLLLKDLELFEEKMKRVLRQLPHCQEFYNGLTPEKKARIDAAVAAVNPYHEKQAFVGECIAEYKRKSVGGLFSKKLAEEPAESAGMSAG